MAGNEVEPKNFHYDVALSFAGEDREYVEAVAKALRAKNTRVFYDGYEEASLWGKDLYTHLTQVYQNDARFTVIFISHYYAEKLWTNHERQGAQARAFSEHREYILPARFDDAEVPGILRTTAYVDLRRKSPAELAELIADKLRSVTKRTPRPRHILVSKDFDATGQILFWAAIAKGESYENLCIAVDPQQYSSFDEILDDLFANYLFSHFGPFTYGSKWIISEEGLGGRLLVPAQWVTDHVIHEIAPEWIFSSIAELGLIPNTSWDILAVSDAVYPAYAFGCDNPQLWNAMTSYPKTPALLTGYLKKEPLDRFVAGSHKYVGVFQDWLRIGSGCAWVEPEEPLRDEVRDQLDRVVDRTRRWGRDGRSGNFRPQ
jgi:hypothetical protein